MRARASRYSARERHPRKTRLHIWCFALLAVVGLLASLFLGRFFELRRLQGELSVLVQQERQALAAQEELRERLALKDEPETIEQKARELLGLVKPDEEKVIFVEGD